MKSKSHTKCPICDTANPPHINNYHLCRVCDSFYLFPIKSKDYTQGYWDAYYAQYMTDSCHVLNYHTLIDANKHLFTENVIEIGSGIGYFIRALNEVNIPNIGVDNNHTAITYAKLYNKAKIDYMDIEDPFDMIEMAGKIKAKTVCIYNTLEGLRTPVQTMKYIKQFSEKYIHIIVSNQSVHTLTSTNFCMYSEATIVALADKIDCVVKGIVKDGEKYEVTLCV